MLLCCYKVVSVFDHGRSDSDAQQAFREIFSSVEWLLDAGCKVKTEAGEQIVEGTPEGIAAGVGNYPQKTDDHDDVHYVQFCHGASGVVFLLTKVHETVDLICTRNAREAPDWIGDVGGNGDWNNYRQRIEDKIKSLGAMTWQYGLLRKGPGLCHGVVGNGYALLAIARYFQSRSARAMDAASSMDNRRTSVSIVKKEDPVLKAKHGKKLQTAFREAAVLWLRRAQLFGLCIQKVEHATGAMQFNLFEGSCGAVVFLGDLIKVDGSVENLHKARFPMFEIL